MSQSVQLMFVNMLFSLHVHLIIGTICITDEYNYKIIQFESDTSTLWKI